jgi:hypothetical protein
MDGWMIVIEDEDGIPFNEPLLFDSEAEARSYYGKNQFNLRKGHAIVLYSISQKDIIQEQK